VLTEIQANIALLDPAKATWKNAARVCMHQALNFREYAELGASDTGIVLDMLGEKMASSTSRTLLAMGRAAFL
jgi:hypothetical protein